MLRLLLAAEAGAPRLGAADGVVFGAGVLLLLGYGLARAVRRDPLAGAPPVAPRTGPAEALAVIAGVLFLQAASAWLLVRAGSGAPVTILLSGSAVSTAAVAVAWRFLPGRPAGHGPRARGAAVGLLGWVGSFPLVAGVLLLWTALLRAAGRTWAEQEVLTHLRERPVAFFVVAVLLAPLYEEVLFRGLLHGALRRRGGAVLAAAVSAATFTLAHHHLPTVPAHFVLGLALSFVYEKTGTLAGPMAFHAAFNLWQFLAEAGGR